MKLKADYKLNYRNYGEIVVPAGTPVTHRTASGPDPDYHFVDEFTWIYTDYPHIASMLRLDVYNYGINIPKAYIQ
jgi:hypothetical protein